MEDIIVVPKVPKNFECKMCCYKTIRESQYNRHLLTSKHLIKCEKNVEGYENENIINLVPSVEETKCSCGKEYKHYSGLWRHKKKCTILNQEETEVKKEGITLKMTDIENALPNMDMNVIITFMKDTQEFKQIMLKQSNTIMEQRKMMEQNKQMISDQNKLMADLVKKLTIPHYIK